MSIKVMNFYKVCGKFVMLNADSSVTDIIDLVLIGGTRNHPRMATVAFANNSAFC